MQNEAIPYFGAKISPLKTSEKEQSAKSMSAAHNQAVMQER